MAGQATIAKDNFDAVSSPIPNFDSLLPRASEADAESQLILDRELETGSDDDSLEIPAAGFPEVERQVSVSETKTDYPSSGLASYRSLGLFEKTDAHNSAEITGDISAACVEKPNLEGLHEEYFLWMVDVRTRAPGLLPFRSYSFRSLAQPNFRQAVAERFCCEQQEIKEVRFGGNILMIVGARRKLRTLIVDFEDSFGCLLVDPDSFLEWGLQKCAQWVKELRGLHSAPQVCLLHNGQRLERCCALQDLSNLEKLSLVRPESYIVKFLYRVSQHSEKLFYIECASTDYVREVKAKFLQVYRHEQNIIGLADPSPKDFWLFKRDRILRDYELLVDVWNPFAPDSLFTQETHSGRDLLTDDIIFVSFQPADAVLVKVHYKSDPRKVLKSEIVILLSSQASAQELRQEISKVVHKDAQSFKMIINGRKIEQDSDLKPLLNASSCVVVVEQQPKVQIMISRANSSSDDGLSLALNKYDKVDKLKEDFCSVLNMPSYCVDLLHNNVCLCESKDLRASRLRNGDTVQALVMPHRVRVRIRLQQGHWEEVVIDDVTVSTVEHLKGYIFILMKETLQQQDHVTGRLRDCCLSSGNVSIKVLLNNTLLPDCVLLKEAGVAMNCRILVFIEESLCYTVAFRGRIPLFIGFEKTDCQPPKRIMAMSDGKRLFLANPPDASSDPPEIFSIFNPSPPVGIGRCSRRLQAQFPSWRPPSHQQTSPTINNPHQTSPTTSNPHQTASSPDQRSVCHTSKSVSMPALSSIPPPSHMTHSRSESFKTQTSSPHGMDSLGLGVGLPKHRSTPTEKETGEKQGRTQRLCAAEADSPCVNFPEGYVSEPDTSTPRKHRQTLPTPPLSPLKSVRSGACPAEVNNNTKKELVIPKESSEMASVQILDRLLTPVSSQRTEGKTKPRHHSENTSCSKRSFLFQRSVEENSDGRYVANFRIEAEEEISAEMANSLKLASNCNRLLWPPSQRYQPTITYSDDLPSDLGLPEQDRTFAYIKKDVINYVASQLAPRDEIIFLRLLSNATFEKIKAENPQNLNRAYFDSLVKWLQTKREKATVAVLISLLKEHDRADIAEGVEVRDNSGYETAPP